MHRASRVQILAQGTSPIPPPLSPTSLPVSSTLSYHNEGKKKKNNNKYCIVNLTGHHFCGPSHRLKAVEGRWSLVSFFYLHCEETISLHPSPGPAPAPGPSPVHAPSLCPGLDPDRAPSLFLALALSLDCSKVCEGSSGLLDHDCDLFEENKGWIRGYYKKHEVVQIKLGRSMMRSWHTTWLFFNLALLWYPVNFLRGEKKHLVYLWSNMIKYTVKYTIIFKKWYTDLVKPKLYSSFYVYAYHMHKAEHRLSSILLLINCAKTGGRHML